VIFTTAQHGCSIYSKSSMSHGTHRLIHEASPLHGTQRVLHKSSPLQGTQRVIHKSSQLRKTQEVIHKSSPLHGTQSDPQIQSAKRNTKSDPQIQPVTWNTNSDPLIITWNTNSDPHIQPVTWNTKCSTNPARYMEHKQWSTYHYMEHKQWSTYSAPYMEHTVIHKSSPYMEHRQWSTNPARYMEHKQWSTYHHMEHKVIHKSSPYMEHIQWSTNPARYMEHKLIHKSSLLCGKQREFHHISGQWQRCTNIFFIPSGAIHRHKGNLTTPFPLVCPVPWPCQSNPYINVFFSCSWYTHPIAGSTLLMKHVLIFTVPQKVTLRKTVMFSTYVLKMQRASKQCSPQWIKNAMNIQLGFHIFFIFSQSSAIVWVECWYSTLHELETYTVITLAQ